MPALLSFALLPIVIFSEEHDHDAVCAPPDHILHAADLECINHEEHCGLHVTVKLEDGQTLNDLDDACSALKETCAYAVADDGSCEYSSHMVCLTQLLDDGHCTFSHDSPECPTTMADNDRVSCIAQHIEECEGYDLAGCHTPCVWHAECGVNGHFCHHHCSGASADGQCAEVSFTCPLLMEVEMECANVGMADQLNDYCIGKDNANSSRIAIYILDVVTLLACGFIFNMTSIRTKAASFSGGGSCNLYINALFGILFSALLSHSFIQTLVRSTDYSEVAEWSFSVPYSPHWLIYPVALILMFYIIHNLGAIDVKGQDAKAVMNARVVEFGIECIAWGTMQGAQVMVSQVWVWCVLSLSCCVLRMSTLQLPKKYNIALGIVAAITLPLMNFITYAFVVTPYDGPTSSALYAVFAGIQGAIALFRINVYLLNTQSRSGSIIFLLCLLVGMGISILLFFFGEHHYLAWNEVFIYAAKNGLIDSHTH